MLGMFQYHVERLGVLLNLAEKQWTVETTVAAPVRACGGTASSNRDGYVARVQKNRRGMVRSVFIEAWA